MTTKQQKFFKNLLCSSSNSEAARKAGYSNKSCRVSAHKNITKYNEYFFTLFHEVGLDDKILAKNIKKGLSSNNEHIRYKYTKLSLDLIAKSLSSNIKEESKNEPQTLCEMIKALPEPENN